MNIPAANPGKQQKFRPVLTAVQINKILELAKLEQPLSLDAISLIATLSPFQAKILNQGITPAYTLAPAKAKVNSLESLGGTYNASNPHHIDDSMSKKTYWEMCYIEYTSAPASCTLDQIQAAREHMYLNDLMSADEMVEFEQAATEGSV
jgi:hypothetical protein